MLSSLLILMCGYCFCACDKILLLTDQDVMQSIQSELQSLRQKIIQLENSQSRISVENTALKSELAHVNGQLATLQQTAKKASSTYVVWGRKTCPKKNGTSMIYSGLGNRQNLCRHLLNCDINFNGITAGKQWYEKGSGVTALCLPHDPESANADFPSSGDNLFAYLWGSEYQFSYRHMAVEDDAPCAVCKVQGTSTLMVPAKRSCPTGWTFEYSGVLVAGASSEFAFEYICIDENPEFFEGTRSHNDNGLTLHPVRARCGSLPCPPYTENQYIPCVVCSH